MQVLGYCSFAWMGEESLSLIQTQLDTNLFHDTIPEVRSALHTDDFSVQGWDKWMTIPDIGYPITYRYSVILISFSMNLNITFFPLVIAPCITSTRHKIIAVVFINNNHWVKVKLKLICPWPSVIDWWRWNCSEVLKAWELTYAGRIRHSGEVTKKTT